MGKQPPTGKCHICGTYGSLTFEHIPPKAAFNDQRVIVLQWDEPIVLGPSVEARGRVQQKGVGGYTLCEKCNNNTGSWYGKSFVDWCYQGMDVLRRSGGRPRLIYLHHIRPLAVLKQLVCMFLSVNGEDFQAGHEALVRFVLNKDVKYLPPRYRFFVYYTIEGNPRTAGTIGVLNFDRGEVSLQSEIAYPPYGYVMTLNSKPPLDRRLVEITHFAAYEYGENVTAPLHLPVLPTHTQFPADYRTKEEIAHQAAETSSTIESETILAVRGHKQSAYSVTPRE